jgi:P27 family predicted phage terminase small subunit
LRRRMTRMKTPGPPPTPTNLRALLGNPGKRRLNQREPDPEPAIPSCPSFLNKEARREWRRVTKLLFPLGLITHPDRATLAGYCDAYARAAEASRQLQRYGLIVKSPNGYPMQSPYLAILNTALQEMRASCTEFGMTPSSRSRVKTANPKQRSLFDDFLDQEETG